MPKWKCMWVWLFSYDNKWRVLLMSPRTLRACGHWASFFFAVCIFSLHYIMPYIFVRCLMSYLDGRDAFDCHYRSRHDRPTFVDFQLAKEGNDQKLSVELKASMENLSARLSVFTNALQDPSNKQANYETYECKFPPHVVLNELDICAGYKVIAANTTKETFVWTLYKPWNYRRAATICNLQWKQGG